MARDEQGKQQRVEHHPPTREVKSEAGDDARGAEFNVGMSAGTADGGGATLWEQIFSRGNLFAALARVEANGGAPGVDGLTVEALRPYLKAHWLEIRAALDTGSYRPQPVRRVEIPKPDGGVRLLGIPMPGSYCISCC
jgi:RNA-directed DNA polymerase